MPRATGFYTEGHGRRRKIRPITSSSPARKVVVKKNPEIQARRTVYRVITDRGEQKATSKKDALLTKKVLDDLGRDYPGTFPKVERVVRRRLGRTSFNGIHIWVILSEKEIRQG